jgi:ethylene-insensitive protein 2
MLDEDIMDVSGCLHACTRIVLVHKSSLVSRYVEALSLLAFLLTLPTNIIFAEEILFGDSTLDKQPERKHWKPCCTSPYTVIVMCSCASIAFAALAVTPLESSCNEAKRRLQSEMLDTTHRIEAISLENGVHEKVQMPPLQSNHAAQ